MDKIKKFLFILLIGFIMLPLINAEENVEIKSITLENKTETTTINSEPTFSGLTMNYDVSFKATNDYAKYKVIVKNNTKTDYRISEDTSFNTSEYINYKYEVDGELKANSEVIVYVTITYTKEVDSSQLVNNKYTENNKAVVQLLNDKEEIVNPKTGVASPILLLISISVLATCVVIMINKKEKSAIMILLIGVCLIPMITYAVETIKLTINVDVTIDATPETPVTPPEPEVPKYNVGYLLNDGTTLFTDSELEASTRTTDTECTTVYIGETKYNNCTNVIYKDSTEYAEGSQVTLKQITIKYLDFDYRADCTLQADNSYLCPSDSEISNYTIERWYYDNLWNNYGYTYDTTDKSVMNFSNYNFDYWDSDGYFSVNAPQAFTMPGHSALFAVEPSKVG